jgi:hypothetical protein
VGQRDRPQRQHALAQAGRGDQIQQALVARAHQEGRRVEAEALALRPGCAASGADLALDELHAAAGLAQRRGRRDARQTAAHDQHLRCAHATSGAHVVAEPARFAA